MTIPGLVLRQLGPLEQQAEIEKARQEEAKERKGAQEKAAAHQAVARSLGIPVGRMTPAQRAMADATARSWKAGGSVPRGYGFSIDTSGRKPNG